MKSGGESCSSSKASKGYKTVYEENHLKVVDHTGAVIITYKPENSRRTCKMLANLNDGRPLDPPADGDSEASSTLEKSLLTCDDRRAAISRPPSLVQSAETMANQLGYRIRSLLRTVLHFRGLKLIQLLLAAYISVLTFADIGPPGGLRDPKTGQIIDQASPERTECGLILVHGTLRAIVAETKFQAACIGIARISAWLMYPGKNRDF